MLEIKNSNGTYATEGSSVDSGNQFFITEDSIETVDILLVSTPISLRYALLTHFTQGQHWFWRASLPSARSPPLDVSPL